MLLLWTVFESWGFKSLGNCSLHDLLVCAHIYQLKKFWSQIDLNRSTTTNCCCTILDSCECFINYSYNLCQVVFLDRRNLLAGGIGEERQTYQVQGNNRRRLSFLRNLEKGSIWSRSSFHFLH
jgi:hypothetical protein